MLTMILEMVIHKQKIMLGLRKFLLVAQILRWMVMVIMSEPLTLRWMIIIMAILIDMLIDVAGKRYAYRCY